MFRIAERRFGPMDTKICVTHLAFLQRLDWATEAGKVLERFKQVLAHVEDVWIFAARFDSNAADNARRHLVEGLRIHGSSIPIYREWFMLELQALAKMTDDKEAGHQMVELAFSNAVEATNEPLFATELLGLAIKSKIPKTLYQQLKKALMEKHGDKCSTWASLAALELYENPHHCRTLCQKVEDATDVLLNGIDKLQSQEMVEESIRLLQQVHGTCPGHCNPFMFRILDRANSYNLLSAELTEIHNEYK